jgi:parallel beta-helix repeat protein
MKKQTLTLSSIALLALLPACDQPAPQPTPQPPMLEEPYTPDTPEVSRGPCPPGRLRDDDGGCEIILAEPELPHFDDWECPEGWESFSPRERYQIPLSETGPNVEDFLACRAPDHRPAAEVPLGYRNATHSSEPVPIGAPCPADGQRWPSPDELRARAPGYDGPLVYIAPDADPDAADGTQEAPYPSLRAALERASSPGALFALATGTYEERDWVAIRSPIALVGACVQETIYRSTDRDLFIDVGGVLVTNISFDSAHDAITVNHNTGDGPITLQGIEIQHARYAGILVNHSDVPILIDDVSVRARTQEEPYLDNAILIHNSTHSTTIQNTWVSSYLRQGIRVTDSPKSSYFRIILQDSQPTEKRKESETTDVYLRDAALYLIRSNDSTIEEIITEKIHKSSISVYLSKKSKIKNIQSKSTTKMFYDIEIVSDGYAIHSQGSDNIVIENVLSENNASGILLTRNSKNISISNTISKIHNTWVKEVDTGSGVQTKNSTRISIKKSLFIGALAGAMNLNGDASFREYRDPTHTIEDVWTFGGNLPQVGDLIDISSYHAPGIKLTAAIPLTGRRVLIENAIGIGIITLTEENPYQTTTFNMNDITIRDTQPPPPSLFYREAGASFACLGGCKGTIQKIKLSNNHFSGIILHGKLTDIKIENLQIEKTKTFQSQNQTKGGAGIISIDDVTLKLDQFSIETQQSVALSISKSQKISLSRGNISNNAVGFDGVNNLFQENKFTQRDLYLDNDVNFSIGQKTNIDALLPFTIISQITD